jgi:spore germination protein
MTKLRWLNLGLLLALLLYQATALAGPLKAWAYSVWWLPDAWRNAPLGNIDRLLFFELKVNSNGEISERNGWPEKWADLRLEVKKKNTPLDLTLTLFDIATFNNVFNSPEATRRLLEESVLLARQDGVAGLQLDFEIYTAIAPDTLTRYRGFIRELSNRLRRQSPARNLSIFFPIGGESALYDAATLRLVNHVVLQGYDAHWKGSKTAGPLSPLNGNEVATWKKAVAQGVALGVPKARMLLSFPLYGYEWEVRGPAPRSETIGSGVTTSFAPLPEGVVPDIQFNILERTKKYGSSHDPVSGSSYYQFKRKNGEFVEGWFEDAKTLKRKSDYLDDEKLGGIAFFPLGYDNGQLIDSFLRRRGASGQQDAGGSR